MGIGFIYELILFLQLYVWRRLAYKRVGVSGSNLLARLFVEARSRSDVPVRWRRGGVRLLLLDVVVVLLDWWWGLVGGEGRDAGPPIADAHQGLDLLFLVSKLGLLLLGLEDLLLEHSGLLNFFRSFGNELVIVLVRDSAAIACLDEVGRVGLVCDPLPTNLRSQEIAQVRVCLGLLSHLAACLPRASAVRLHQLVVSERCLAAKYPPP